MKLKMPCAALLAAFVLALGLMFMPQNSKANNDDVELLQPPMPVGPDEHGGGREAHV